MNPLKKIRLSKNITLKELSIKANVAIGYISTLENDTCNNTNPSKEIMTKISNALGESVPKVFFPNDI